MMRHPSGSSSSPLLLGCRSALFTLIACLVSAIPVHAQSASAGSMELPDLLPLEREILLARSAAPPEVSDEATVLVLRRGTGYEVAVEGTNGVTCMVDRTWKESLEPICYDREASATILGVHRHFALMRERGMSREEVEADRDAQLQAGTLRAPSRPALTWMLSAEQILYSDDGQRIGAWEPHIMIYYPGMTAEGLGLPAGPLAGGPWLSDSGLPTATLVIGMPDFIPVRDERETGR